MLTSAGGWNEIRQNDITQVDACLLKPVRQSQLMNALATVWARRSGAAGQPVPAPADASPGQPGWAARFAGVRLRVLVVEDNPVNQKVAVLILARFGLRSDVAGNGLEAVQMAGTLRFDLVFMDCQMPEMDGYAATAEIRRREKPGEHVVIVAMTAEALAGARDRCIAAGMDDYITKPVKMRISRRSWRNGSARRER